MKSLSNISIGVFVLILLPIVGLFLIITGLLNLDTTVGPNDQVSQFSQEALYAQATVGKKFVSKSSPPPGTSSASGPSGSSYWIEFSFKDVKGRIVKSSRIVDESTYDQFDVNDHLTVKYLKDKPGIFKIVNASDAIGALVPKIFIVIGALSLIISFLYLRLLRKKPSIPTK